MFGWHNARCIDKTVDTTTKHLNRDISIPVFLCLDAYHRSKTGVFQTRHTPDKYTPRVHNNACI
jgi:hypothetical protein